MYVHLNFSEPKNGKSHWKDCYTYVAFLILKITLIHKRTYYCIYALLLLHDVRNFFLFFGKR